MWRLLSSVFLILVLSSSCREEYTPKPRVYTRINFPPHQYHVVEQPCPFLFESPVYGILARDTAHYAGYCWQNLYMPPFNATLHLTYHAIDSAGKFDKLTEESRRLVYQHHTLKAEEIIENHFENPTAKVYGIIYELEGNTATAYQFYVSDSSRHFVRGVLYYNSRTENDSVAPMTAFMKQDMNHLVRTLQWK